MSTGQTEDDGAGGKLHSQPVKCSRDTSEFVDPVHNKAHGLCYREKTLERDRQVHAWHTAERVKSGQFITLRCCALEVFTTPDV